MSTVPDLFNRAKTQVRKTSKPLGKGKSSDEEAVEQIPVGILTACLHNMWRPESGRGVGSCPHTPSGVSERKGGHGQGRREQVFPLRRQEAPRGGEPLGFAVFGLGAEAKCGLGSEGPFLPGARPRPL